MELIYIADPMCSWCYGFHPVITALAERCEAELPLRLMMGGGGPAPAHGPRRQGLSAPGLDARGRCHGSAFRHGLFAREGFTYDTEPACRAVVSVRRLQPALALPFLARMQPAFYAENRDITAPEEIAGVAEEAGLAQADFVEMISAPPRRNETFRDFLTAQELGIRGFPTLIAGSSAKGYALVSNGYRPLEDLLDPLERWLAAGAPLSASA
jgi:putative protein-disulfide isomerase